MAKQQNRVQVILVMTGLGDTSQDNIIRVHVSPDSIRMDALFLEDMRSALNDYGNPALYYRLKESPDRLLSLLSHLAAIIRGLGRLGCQSDLALLDGIKIRQDQFMGLHPDRRYQMLVRHVMRLIDASKAAICSRNC